MSRYFLHDKWGNPRGLSGREVDMIECFVRTNVLHGETFHTCTWRIVYGKGYFGANLEMRAPNLKQSVSANYCD